MPYGVDLRRRRGGRGDGERHPRRGGRGRDTTLGLVLLLASWTGMKRPDGADLDRSRAGGPGRYDVCATRWRGLCRVSIDYLGLSEWHPACIPRTFRHEFL